MNLFKTDATIITPNRRLAAVLLKQHQAEQNTKCWHTPDILPLSTWVERLWREDYQDICHPLPYLLTANQEQILWETILRQAPENEGLLQISRTAELAKSAWGILKHWQVSHTHPGFNATEDNIAFQKWAAKFQTLCQTKHWLESNSLIEEIITRIQQKTLVLPKKLILVGFTELTPLQRKLFTICAENNTIVTFYEQQHKNNQVNRIALKDAETEIQAMAEWAKTILTDHCNKNIKIGCIIPNLEDKRNQVIRIFANTFSEKNIYQLNYLDLPFNISAGKTLGSYPIIHTALQLLSIGTDKLSLASFSSILRSPFLGEAEQERLARARFERLIHNSNLLSFSLKKLITSDDKLGFTSLCPAFGERLKNYFATLSQQKKYLPISHWVEVFLDLLKILGWPGERNLNSIEYQIIQNSWLPLLAEYSAFDMVLPEQSYKTALHYLMRITTNTVFQPQSPEAPIQILGMLEAAEVPFDYLWISGMDDSAWPPPAKPNPFIPHRLQKTLNMPNASPDRELEYSKKLTAQLQNSADFVIFSHALQNDNSELRPSALIKDAREITLTELDLVLATSPAEKVFVSDALESITDNHAPPISDNELIRGGATILKLQAACPFKSFAELRLHAKQLDKPSIGLRPQDRGNIVHKALEHIWQDLEDLPTLKQLSAQALEILIDKHAKKAIFLIAGEKSRYLELELQRLKKILHNWLQLEKMRPHFRVILREEERLFNVGKIAIKLRVDRIDELEDGSKLIIDYKTGKNNQIKSWFDDRPEEPQLLLYCLTEPANTVGISFAEIHPDSLKIKGISKCELNIAGMSLLTEVKYTQAASWEEQIQQWQQTLEKLSNDFYQGNAEVNPKHPEETCRYCGLQALCRIYETE